MQVVKASQSVSDKAELDATQSVASGFLTNPASVHQNKTKNYNVNASFRSFINIYSVKKLNQSESLQF